MIYKIKSSLYDIKAKFYKKVKSDGYFRIANRKLCFGLFCHSDPELKRRGRISSFFHQTGFSIRDSSGH